MNKNMWKAMLTLPAIFGLILLAGCGKKETTEERPAGPAAAGPAATAIDPATAATVSGTVKLDGAAPKAAKIDMSQHPASKGTNLAETPVASDGHVPHLFVY